MRNREKEMVEILTLEDGGYVQLPESVLNALKLAAGKEIKVRLAGDRVTIERHIADPFAEYRDRPDAPSLNSLIQADSQKKKVISEEFEGRLKEKPEFTPEDHPDFWR